MCQRYNNGNDQFFIPQRPGSKCKADGAFEEIQCDDKSKECWCVDQNGYEITSTRTTGSIKCPTKGEMSFLTHLNKQRLQLLHVHNNKAIPKAEQLREGRTAGQLSDPCGHTF